jgi:hypothetical protein
MTGRTRRRLKELEAVVTTPGDLEAEIERARNVLKGELELAVMAVVLRVRYNSFAIPKPWKS